MKRLVKAIDRHIDAGLQIGDRVRWNGELYKCVYVNDSRAHCVPVQRKQKTITTLAGVTKTIFATGRAIDICPFSPREVTMGGEI